MAHTKPTYREIDPTRKTRLTRIHRIGIELEGGWITLPDPDVRVVHDGSVRDLRVDADPRLVAEYHDLGAVSMTRPLITPEIKRYTTLQRILTNLVPQYVGEIPSPPLVVKAEDGETFWETWIRKFYPPVSNHTCGLHVHMSFTKALYYSRLMKPEYPLTMFEFLRRWAVREGTFLPTDPIWARFSGKNEYCTDNFWPDHQARTRTKDHDRQREGNRYTGVNYPFAVHSTIECRMLPMFPTVEQAIRAIREVLNITNVFLATDRESEPAHVAEVPLDSSSYTEETLELI